MFVQCAFVGFGEYITGAVRIWEEITYFTLYLVVRNRQVRFKVHTLIKNFLHMDDWEGPLYIRSPNTGKIETKISIISPSTSDLDPH